jgi:hypothetical protein
MQLHYLQCLPEVFQTNEGAGYVFGQLATEKFLEMNNLGHICRAHQLCMEGYQLFFDDLLSTVWSAPNYCYRAGNLASVLEISPSLERYFNVFGPCPDEERNLYRYEPVDRVAEMLDHDGVEARRGKLESITNQVLTMFDQTVQFLYVDY